MEGTIVKGIAGFYYVKCENKVIECSARGKFRHTELTPTVGDRVNIDVVNGKGAINLILKRHNKLIRPAVANVDQAFVVCSIKTPDLNMELLNSFLLLCEYNKIKPIICINKVDLVTEDEILDIKNKFINTSYEIFPVSTKKNIGILELKELLKGKTTVFCGPSGVGKSSILNAIAGVTLMETGDISAKLKRGKHTTRHSELLEASQGFVVDTPGFSSIEIDFIQKDDLKYCFPEFHEFNDTCKFAGCMHYKEPSCSVKNAVEEGLINKERYDFYVKTLEKLNARRTYK